ncbi:uncharacterized protein TRUGW13939_09720 [Talaromyces rugulosus]|uniref:Uncharacterized protein n=1 Tax=Talaromyces rugulosus TaxID=121627 RepID=A0A7H8R844_TALRU|nr:uncharacterized protein TRUGW13939_09720 [Talaromyces rugulosus]QKX62559.1 hypothetical protein TRUGW13939_09720 [Talaromyces rugulosus]
MPIYCAKLKRRLEDAASSSASPEKLHASPEQPKSANKSYLALSCSNSTRSKQPSKTLNHLSTSETEMSMQLAYGAGLQEDYNMFSQQSTQQLLTLPPLFLSHPSHWNLYGQFNYSSQLAHSYHPYQTIAPVTSTSKSVEACPDDEVIQGITRENRQ